MEANSTPTPRAKAALLVARIELEAWFAAGMKRYQGQAQLKRICNYLTETVWMQTGGEN